MVLLKFSSKQDFGVDSLERTYPISVHPKGIGCLAGWVGTIVLVGLMTPGCASEAVYVPDPPPLRGVSQGSEGLVLFRLTVLRDAETLQPFDALWPLELFELGLANKDSGVQMHKVTGYSPTAEAKAQGWFYLVLKPGTYQLWVIPPIVSFGVFQNHQDAIPMPAVHFEVPRGGVWHYGGSLRLVCSGGTSWWSGVFLETCQESFQVIDEFEGARAIAGDSAGESVNWDRRLARAEDRNVTPSVDPHGLPVRLVSRGAMRWQSPEWRNRALERVGVSPHGVELSMSGLGGISTILYLLYLPFGITIGEIWGGSNEGTWQACMDDLGEAIRRLDFQKAWIQTLERKLESQGIRVMSARHPSDPETSSQVQHWVWTTGVDRVQLRECKERGRFCLEVSIRLQIRRSGEDGLVYDEFLLYSSPTGRPDPFYERPFRYALLPAYRTYERLLANPSPCLPLEAYCQENGKSSLESRIRQVFQTVADAYLERFDLTGTIE